MPRGDKKQIMLKDIMFPCLAEQRKITDFFSSIDCKINLAQKQLNNLQLLKKGLMQQMFV